MYGSTSQAEKAPNKSFQRTAKSAAEFNRYAILLSGGGVTHRRILAYLSRRFSGIDRRVLGLPRRVRLRSVRPWRVD